ncbi:MAG TPA: NADPH-dependent FMN reductase [Nocardioides sp.]|uniref:NADPH-dependent FMN reductase n=1 Tax=Nocardioides sp. TaxID=35761 RepID=UPI002E355163|nr:NADPH-dependent FMN reductase [Nocardioides sp.]HEX5088635.1 NADPH-dependent FMN reductase [Nocardioides sp.]
MSTPGTPHTRAWAAEVASYDGLVFVTPECNHGMPAALKNAIDLLHREWNDKVAGFVSYGSVGGVRPVEQLCQVVVAQDRMAALGVAPGRAILDPALDHRYSENTHAPHVDPRRLARRQVLGAGHRHPRCTWPQRHDSYVDRPGTS